MFDTSKPYTFDRVVRIAIAALIVYAVIYLLGYLSQVLIPFAIAILLAYLINPLTNLIQKKLKARIWAVIVSLVGISAVLFLIGWILAPLIAREIKYVGGMLYTLYNNLIENGQLSEGLPNFINEFVLNLWQTKEFQDALVNEGFLAASLEIIRKFIPELVNIIGALWTLLTGLLGFLIVLLYLIFILLYYERIRIGWKELIPARFKVQVLDFVHEFEDIMNRYFRNQALVAGTVGVLFATGFGIIGLPLGIFIGIGMGILNMVPYLQIVGYIPILLSVSLYALEHGEGFWMMAGLATLVVAIVQSFQDIFLVPKIMGRVTGFNPAMILLSISIWGKLLGLFGLIIALPLTYLLLAYYRRFILGAPVIKRKNQDLKPPAT
ncbi:MAG: AI-2E family transporter [Bacteroidetes bacterium]|nr:AI-2E family transporter [Bacteroidota bacterium]